MSLQRAKTQAYIAKANIIIPATIKLIKKHIANTLWPAVKNHVAKAHIISPAIKNHFAGNQQSNCKGPC